MTDDLFTPLELRETSVPNRVMVSPMCQYSCEDRDGIATDWHLVHLGSRAVGGAGIVMTEATAVESRGRISPEDLGIWSDEHGKALAPVASFIEDQGSVPAIQPPTPAGRHRRAVPGMAVNRSSPTTVAGRRSRRAPSRGPATATRQRRRR